MAHNLPYGTPLPAGLGFSTVLADIDVETYSEAGWKWDGTKWASLVPNKPGGLPCVGAAAYFDHPTTELLSFTYDLKDGRGRRLWLPSMPFPEDLRGHIARGKLIAAWNASFEERALNILGARDHGFPYFPPEQFRCDMAKSRAFCWPGALAKAGEVAGLDKRDLKLKEGTALIKRYCCPRTPTKTDPRQRLRPDQDGAAGLRLYQYNGQDIHAEAAIAALIPDLDPVELEYWQLDQRCNRRGVRMDVETIDAMVEMLDKMYAEANLRCHALTGGAVNATTEVEALGQFLTNRGHHMGGMTDGDVTAALASPTIQADPTARELLQLRQSTASASVKKAYTMKRMLTKEGRLHDLFIYHSARTGRDAGADAQPQNLTSGGPSVSLCLCGTYFTGPSCSECSAQMFDARPAEWGHAAVKQAIPLIRARDKRSLDRQFGSAISAMGGCMRSLFMADGGHDFIATDYSSIEAVVAAALAGEQWRLDTFAAKESIYLASVSQIKGTDMEVYKRYKEETGLHHPDRKVGKVAELASGFGGWVGAWRNFGADEVFDNECELKCAILAWRATSPAIVEMWGGQFRGLPWKDDYRPELYGLEGCAIAAVQSPGEVFSYRGISYVVAGGTLYCTMLSGRRISYHNVELRPDGERGGLKISFMGWNTNPKMGPSGWVRMFTYGGKLFENVVQATARDILVNAAINCEKYGYLIVLRVHDELVTMVPEGTGSVEELERICGMLPTWAQGWPVHAAGGWRGKRYRK